MSKRGRFFVIEKYWSNENSIAYTEADFSSEYKWVVDGNNYVCNVHGLLRALESYGKGEGIEGYEDILSTWSCETPVYIFACKYCGKLTYATLNTIDRRGCFMCLDCQSNVRMFEKYGSMKEKFPELEEYYSEENNKPYGSIVAYYNSREKIYLKCPRCEEMHLARLDSVIKSGTAYCAQCKKAINRLSNGGSLRDYSDRVANMYEGGNEGKSARDISPHASIKARFKCTNGGKEHFFTAYLHSVCEADKKGLLGCPVCAGFKVVEGINDFASRCPEIAKYWDYDKNEGVSPTEVSYNSSVDYWFICEKGHSFCRDPLHLMRYKDKNAFNGCTVCSGKAIQTGVNDLATLNPDVLDYWDFDRNTISPDCVGQFSNELAWFRCKCCGKSFEYNINRWSITEGRCESCRKTQGYSKGEKEVAEFLKSKGLKVEERVRLDDIELDIYIPEKGIAIEYNGLYYHSTAVREASNYHFHKYDVCKKNDIRLYFIWEDDYINKKDLVLSTLLVKLGISDDLKVNARDCKIVDNLPLSTVREFCCANHIQGFCSGSYYIGLEKDNTVVAMGIFKVIGNELRLERYCTSCLVRGGFSKILSYVGKLGYEGIFTFSDNCVSEGELYYNNGFVLVDTLPPDYCYLVKNKRVHKFNYRLSRFKEDDSLEYKEGLSERQLAMLNGLPRIYDAGKKKWYKPFIK